ncbi:hypothetical protein [Rhizobium sp. S96]|uniref:hypothetical protein n=1 Tax=Rhizobium sp. S96 TaxID=3055140 RepID=UPI0025AB49B1|nr:hypothetical protein [Rhizobium sp. S96]MDM9622454.1 hypothetical protein [Rhizobium sp. S96]
MKQNWEQLADYFIAAQLRSGDDGAKRALGAIGDIAKHINQSTLCLELFGWSSMLDLCVQQTDVAPFSGPYLRISPLPSGMIEFRYIDTMLEDRQWHRTEAPAQTIGRLEAFFDQLCWRNRSAKGR